MATAVRDQGLLVSVGRISSLAKTTARPGLKIMPMALHGEEDVRQAARCVAFMPACGEFKVRTHCSCDARFCDVFLWLGCRLSLCLEAKCLEPECCHLLSLLLCLMLHLLLYPLLCLLLWWIRLLFQCGKGICRAGIRDARAHVPANHRWATRSL